jgi:hypothetical protein
MEITIQDQKEIEKLIDNSQYKFACVRATQILEFEFGKKYIKK